MHIVLEMQRNEPFELPIHYNQLIQGMIYSSIEPNLASFLHNKGYVSENRVFRLFAFSRLTGPAKVDKTNGTIRFEKTAFLTVSSPVKEFCQSLVSCMLTAGSIRLGSNVLHVKGASLKMPQPGEGKTVVRALSPVTIYSTLLRPDGRKYTCYYQPGEPDYTRLVAANLLKKYQSLYQQAPPEGELTIRGVGPQRLSVITYKGTVVKGYSGRLLINGPTQLVQLALDAGLGGKNSQGFGCIDVVP